MKKWIALALAALMLLTASACAETARGASLTDARLYAAGAEGQVQMMDLSRLEIVLWGQTGAATGNPVLSFEVRDGESCVLGGAAAFSGGSMIDFMLDGMSDKYALDLSYAGLSLDLQEAAQTFIDSDAPIHIQLPAFTGVNLPKLDLTGLLGSFVTGSDGGAQTFTVPHTLINQVLSMAASYLPMLGMEQLGDLSGLQGMVDQMNQSNSGFAIQGTISDDGARAVLTADLHMVENGSTQPQPLFTVELTDAENDVRLSAGQKLDGALQSMFDLTVASNPADAALDVSIDLMGQMELSVSLYTDGGLQVGALNVGMLQEHMSLVLAYGPQGGEDVLILSAETPYGDLTASTGTAETAPGERDGEVDVVFSMPDTQVSVTGALHTGSVEGDASAAANRDAAFSAASRIYLATMTAEQREQLMSEAKGTLSGFMAYLNENFSPVAVDEIPAA